jgi:hypothetical protein
VHGAIPCRLAHRRSRDGARRTHASRRRLARLVRGLPSRPRPAASRLLAVGDVSAPHLADAVCRHKLKDYDLCHFFYRDLSFARGILMGRNIRSAPTLFSSTDLLAYAALGIIKYAFMPKRG